MHSETPWNDFRGETISNEVNMTVESGFVEGGCSPSLQRICELGVTVGELDEFPVKFLEDPHLETFWKNGYSKEDLSPTPIKRNVEKKK